MYIYVCLLGIIIYYPAELHKLLHDALGSIVARAAHRVGRKRGPMRTGPLILKKSTR